MPGAIEADFTFSRKIAIVDARYSPRACEAAAATRGALRFFKFVTLVDIHLRERRAAQDAR